MTKDCTCPDCLRTIIGGNCGCNPRLIHSTDTAILTLQKTLRDSLKVVEEHKVLVKNLEYKLEFYAKTILAREEYNEDIYKALDKLGAKPFKGYI